MQTTQQMTKPRSLICCCGASTIGCQWHNRDDGYGLCADCIDFCTSRQSAEETRSSYGDKDIHYGIVEKS